MTYDDKLDKVEQGIDNLSELLGVSCSEIVDMLIDGMSKPTNKQKDFLSELERTFHEL